MRVTVCYPNDLVVVATIREDPMYCGSPTSFIITECRKQYGDGRLTVVEDEPRWIMDDPVRPRRRKARKKSK